MQLILTSPPKVMVIVKEISFNYGSPEYVCIVNHYLFIRKTQKKLGA